MKTWLIILSVVAVLLAASTGVGFWMFNETMTELNDTMAELMSTETELISTKTELAGTETELAECREDSPPSSTYTLSVSVSPPGAGVVSPSGGEYESGEQVTLTANPDSDYIFDYWSDSVSGTTTTITITMDSDKSVTANFESVPSGISWDEAKNHIGEWATENNPVYGPIVEASYRPDISGQPTWLNIGEDYPSQNRFVVIIWGENRANFPQAPENYYLGKTIYVTGLITEYEGVAQIEVTSPDQIHE